MKQRVAPCLPFFLRNKRAVSGRNARKSLLGRPSSDLGCPVPGIHRTRTPVPLVFGPNNELTVPPVAILQPNRYAVGRHDVAAAFSRRHLKSCEPAAAIDALDHRVLRRAELEADIPGKNSAAVRLMRTGRIGLHSPLRKTIAAIAMVVV